LLPFQAWSACMFLIIGALLRVQQLFLSAPPSSGLFGVGKRSLSERKIKRNTLKGVSGHEEKSFVSFVFKWIKL